MDGAALKSALRGSWFAAIVALVAILAGSVVYVKERIPPSAQGSVAVRDALSINNGGGSSAAVSFDTIIESDRLARAVGRQLHLPAPTVKSALSVSMVASTTGIDISPLYLIKAKAKTVSLAEKLVNSAIAQGRLLYSELNGTNGEQTKNQFASERRSAEASLAGATKAYDEFVASSGGNHAAEISALSAEVNAITGEIASARVAGSSTASLRAELHGTQRRLLSMESMQARYQQLSAALAAAQASAQQITALQQLSDAAGAIPVADEVKVLDYATPAGSGLMKILIYALGLILGLAASFTIVYSEAARQRRRLTLKQLVTALGLPAIGRIPPSAVRRET